MLAQLKAIAGFLRLKEQIHWKKRQFRRAIGLQAFCDLSSPKLHFFLFRRNKYLRTLVYGCFVSAISEPEQVW
jgi:hypothetical protein